MPNDDLKRAIIQAALTAGKNVLADLDLQVMSDITETEGSTDDNPKWRPCYYIGWPTELAAGIRGGQIGPIFDMPEEALIWAANNQSKLEKEISVNT